jgi:hypothetical protein
MILHQEGDALIKTFYPISITKGRRKRRADLRGNVLKGGKKWRT